MTEIAVDSPVFSLRIPESAVADVAGRKAARVARVQEALVQVGVAADNVRIRFYQESAEELAAMMPEVSDAEYEAGILDEETVPILWGSLGGRDSGLDTKIRRIEQPLVAAQLGTIRGLVAVGRVGTAGASKIGRRGVEVIDAALELRSPSFIWRDRFPVSSIVRLYPRLLDVPSVAAGAELAGMTLQDALTLPMADIAERRPSPFRRGDPGSEAAFARQPANTYSTYGPDMKKAIKVRTRALEFAARFSIARAELM